MTQLYSASPCSGSAVRGERLAAPAAPFAPSARSIRFRRSLTALSPLAHYAVAARSLRSRRSFRFIRSSRSLPTLPPLAPLHTLPPLAPYAVAARSLPTLPPLTPYAPAARSAPLTSQHPIPHIPTRYRLRSMTTRHPPARTTPPARTSPAAIVRCHTRKVRNVTRGSSKSTLQITLLSRSLSLLPVTIYVLSSWAYSGPDSGHSAGLSFKGLSSARST